MTDKDRVFSWIAQDDEPGRSEGGDPRAAGDEAHQLESYQRKIDALEAHVAALLDEVKKWKEKAEDDEAKALEHHRRLDEVKKESMKLREEQGHVQEALQKAQLELIWLENEVKSVKGEK
jgi:flagellar biosynthesis chaperone FliJ